MSTLAGFRLGHPTQRRATATTGRSSVPWSGVMALAVVLSLADGFWITSLRGAVGAIERVQSPFASWLRESAMVAPVFVLAVLGTLTLALRWFGPTSSRKHTVLASMSLMVAITTVAGIALLIASSAYDLYLQGRMLVMMDSMRGMCTTSCDSLQKAQLLLQVRSVGFGSGVLLVTNLVVVGWMVALRGGRLDLVRPGTDARAATGTRTSRLDDVRVYLAAGLVGSAVVHAAVVPEHLAEWTAAGVFFVVLTAAQLAVAIQVGARLRTAVLVAAAAISAVPLVVWAYSRSFGLPFGPEAGATEPIGLADSAAGILELGTLVGALLLLRRSDRLRARSPLSAHVHSLVVVAVVAVMVLGLGGSHLGWFSFTDGVHQMSMAQH